MIDLELPYPPTINHYYGTAKSGQRFLKPKGKNFRREVCFLSLKNKVTGFLDSEELALVVDWFPPDRRKRDFDNILKALCDAMQHAGFYKDDSQITQAIIEKREKVEGGKVRVRIVKRKPSND